MRIGTLEVERAKKDGITASSYPTFLDAAEFIWQCTSGNVPDGSVISRLANSSRLRITDETPRSFLGRYNMRRRRYTARRLGSGKTCFRKNQRRGCSHESDSADFIRGNPKGRDALPHARTDWRTGVRDWD